MIFHINFFIASQDVEPSGDNNNLVKSQPNNDSGLLDDLDDHFDDEMVGSHLTRQACKPILISLEFIVNYSTITIKQLNFSLSFRNLLKVENANDYLISCFGWSTIDQSTAKFMPGYIIALVKNFNKFDFYLLGFNGLDVYKVIFIIL